MEKGMYLAADGSGLFYDRLKKNRADVNSEKDIFSLLGLAWKEPEQRI